MLSGDSPDGMGRESNANASDGVALAESFPNPPTSCLRGHTVDVSPAFATTVNEEGRGLKTVGTSIAGQMGGYLFLFYFALGFPIARLGFAIPICFDFALN